MSKWVIVISRKLVAIVNPPDVIDVPLSRANLRIYAEKHEFFRGSKFVSAYVERDKKILKFTVFGVRVTCKFD